MSTNERAIGYIHYQGNIKVPGHYEAGTINTTSDKLEEVYQFVENSIKEMFDKYGMDVKILHRLTKKHISVKGCNLRLQPF